MKTLKAIVLIAVTYAISPMAHGAAARYKLPTGAKFSKQGDNVYYDYQQGRAFDTLRTNQYGALGKIRRYPSSMCYTLENAFGH